MVEQHNFPPFHPEWIQRDHMLIAWAHFHDRWYPLGCTHGNKLDLFGVPILSPALRKYLGDEWYKWSKAQ